MDTGQTNSVWDIPEIENVAGHRIADERCEIADVERFGG
jgi:hypothetical protein